MKICAETAYFFMLVIEIAFMFVPWKHICKVENFASTWEKMGI